MNAGVRFGWQALGHRAARPFALMLAYPATGSWRVACRQCGGLSYLPASGVLMERAR
jgi:hypothetical protein